MAIRRLQGLQDALAWLRARGSARLVIDSRQAGPGDAFVAWPGHATDGRRFVLQALEAGACACLVEADGVEAYGFDDERIAAWGGLKAATGPLAAAWYGEPAHRMQVVATTGTNGKTSTAWWTAQALAALGTRCTVVGTLGIGEPPHGVVATGLTTPDPVTLHASLRRLLDEGVGACAIEASSIGIVEHRLDGLKIDVALFTNFTRDHLDYHGSMEAYWEAKSSLFDWPGLRAAVVNLDDPQGAGLAARLRRRLALRTYSLDQPSDLQARDIGHTVQGLRFDVVEDGRAIPLRTRVIGQYNVSNLLAVIGGLRALGVPLGDAVRACEAVTPVPGRMQQIARADAPLVVVDYAHTPDALDKALAALRPLVAARGGRLWCVFGCGGNRDATKRPLMGAIAERSADRVVVTSDNPRHEPPQAILDQIVAGIGRREHVRIVADRRAAIREAAAGADVADVILVAGKGHEDYQEVAGVKHPFSDVAEAEAALRERSRA